VDEIETTSAKTKIPGSDVNNIGVRHVNTQNAAADALAGTGSAPRSPRPGEPNFDLAWENDGAVYVAEVRSITDRNEEKRLRLGLGQILR
jgi:hypothetical protein